MDGEHTDMTNQKRQYANNFGISLAFFVFVAMALSTFTSIALGRSNNSSSSPTATMPLAVAYAQPFSEVNNSSNTITARLGEPFQLQINQTAIIMPDNMTIRFLDVLEDSRCPASVVCIQAGRVTAALNITESSFPGSRIMNLTLGPSSPNSSSSATKNVDSHIIQLQKVEPHRIRDEQILKSDYRATLVASPPQPIPTGEWNIASNGLHGTLNITSIDSQGHLSGTILLYPFDTPPNEITGYVDGQSGKVTFVRIIGPRLTEIEVYTGYIFSNIVADCLIGTGPGSCYDYATMAGTFESFYASDNDNNNNNTSTLIGTFGDANRNTFGWFASHVPQSCPSCPS